MYIQPIRIRKHIITDGGLKTALKRRKIFRFVLVCRKRGEKCED